MSYVEKSLALDPDLADGYTARGFLRAATGTDWEGSRVDFERALNLNPGAADLHRLYAQAVLAAMGRLPEAIEEARKATEIDPLSALAWSTLGRMYYSSGQLEAARTALEKSLQIAPEQNYAAAISTPSSCCRRSLLRRSRQPSAPPRKCSSSMVRSW